MDSSLGISLNLAATPPSRLQPQLTTHSATKRINYNNSNSINNNNNNSNNNDDDYSNNGSHHNVGTPLQVEVSPRGSSY